MYRTRWTKGRAFSKQVMYRRSVVILIARILNKGQDVVAYMITYTVQLSYQQRNTSETRIVEIYFTPRDKDKRYLR